MAKLQKETSAINPQLHTFAQQQLAAALNFLTNPKIKPDTAIHETRRCFKRLRALLRLIKAELPSEIFARDNALFRDVSRQLSELRDAAARHETFSILRKEFTADLPALAWQETKNALTPKTSNQTKRKVMRAIATSLRANENNFADWVIASDEPEMLQKGLCKIYKRGKREMEKALLTATPESYHEWRKSVNHLRHQSRLLLELKLITNKKFLDEIKRLAQVLGLNHDLDLLGQFLHNANLGVTKQEQKKLQEITHTHRLQFEKEANKIGAQTYQLKPKKFIAKFWR